MKTGESGEREEPENGEDLTPDDRTENRVQIRVDSGFLDTLS